MEKMGIISQTEWVSMKVLVETDDPLRELDTVGEEDMVYAEPPVNSLARTKLVTKRLIEIYRAVCEFDPRARARRCTHVHTHL